MKRPITFIAAGIVLTFLWACGSSREYERNSDYADDLFRSEPADGVSMASENWQNIFNDALLDSLIAEGLRNNLNLQSAVQQVMAAEASFSQSKAALFPSLSVGASHGYTQTSESNFLGRSLEYQTFDLNLQSSWEVDVWGKLSSAKRSAYANMLGTDAARKAVQTRLISDIASAYYSLLALDRKLAITEETLSTNITIVETMKILKENGNVTGAAVVQSEATRFATEASIPDLKQQIKSIENTLCILLGRKPGPIQRGTLQEQEAHEMLSVGVSSELLDNRPDVIQAEYALISALEMTNSAKAYFYPAFTITASGGLSSLDFSDLFDPTSIAANVLSGLTAPIFSKRVNKTRLEVARVQQQQALLNFQHTLLSAGKEVNDALATYEAAQQKIKLREQQLEALNKAVVFTRELLNYGSATYTEVLIAQQTYLAAQLSNVDDYVQNLTSVVTLYRALGGGWSDN